jgi:hypothetical protein
VEGKGARMETVRAIVFYTNKNHLQTNNECSPRSREVVRGGLSGQRTDHNAHTEHVISLVFMRTISYL